MRLTIAYSEIKKRNLVLINNATYQRETLSERPIRQPLTGIIEPFLAFAEAYSSIQNSSGFKIEDRFLFFSS